MHFLCNQYSNGGFRQMYDGAIWVRIELKLKIVTNTQYPTKCIHIKLADKQ